MGWSVAGAALILTFVPGIAGAATAPRWALLSVLVPLFCRPKTWLSEYGWLGAFLLYASASVVWAPVQVEAIGVVWKFFVLVGVFLLGSRCERLRDVFCGLAIGIAVNSVIVLMQDSGLKAWPVVTDHSGLFLNKNFGAEAAALILVGCVYYRIWWGVVATLPTLWFGSRGAWLAIVVVGIVEVWRFNRWLGTAVTGAAVIAGMFAFDAMILNDSTLQRLAVWADVTDHPGWFGHGAGSFYILYPKFANYMNPLFLQWEHVHNDPLELIFEFGVGAALLVPVLWKVKRHPVAVAFMVEACFEFPTYLPVTAAIFAFTAGHYCSLRRVLRTDESARRVSILPGVVFHRHFGSCGSVRASG